MKVRYPSFLALVFAFALTGCAGHQANVGRVVINEATSKLQFFDAQAEKMNSTYYQDNTAILATTAYLAVWRMPKKMFPQVRISYIELGPGYHFPEGYFPIDYIKKLNFGKKYPIAAGARGDVENALGFMRFQRFKVGATGCVAFTRSWTRHLIENLDTDGNARLAGHYCTNSGNQISDSRILSVVMSLGVKGEGTPVPSSEWLEARRSRKSADKIEIPLRIDWPVFGKGLSGTLLTTSLRNEGKIWVSPINDVECSGKWTLSPDKKDARGKPLGEWSILCNNGLIASGAFELGPSNEIVGNGEDSEGNPVVFSFEMPG